MNQRPGECSIPSFHLHFYHCISIILPKMVIMLIEAKHEILNQNKQCMSLALRVRNIFLSYITTYFSVLCSHFEIISSKQNQFPISATVSELHPSLMELGMLISYGHL